MSAPVSSVAILRLKRLMIDAGVEYAFMGGVALNAWGLPRTTFDMDCLVAAEVPERLRMLAGASPDEIDVPPPLRHGFLDQVSGLQKSGFRLAVAGTWIDVDVFLGGTPFLSSVMERRATVPFEETAIDVVSAADLILLKLVADRPKDRLDVQNIVAVQGVPEPDYLRTWAGPLGVADRLDKLLNAAH